MPIGARDGDGQVPRCPPCQRALALACFILVVDEKRCKLDLSLLHNRLILYLEMAEICCGLLSGAEAVGAGAAPGICHATSRATKRQGIDVRRYKILAGMEFPVQGSDGGQKRRKMDVTMPILEVADEQKQGVSVGTIESAEAAFSSCSDRVVEDSRSATADPASSNSNVCPTYGVVSVRGRRRDMEDSSSAHLDILRHSSQIKDRYDFFGVFDGHGCSHVAVSCKERMHEILTEEISHLEKSPSTSLEWKSLMDRSFFRMDSEAASWRGGPEIPACRCEFQTPKCDHVGSTAVISAVSGDHIVVANCGDSRAVLCRNGSPVPLSNDQKPDRPDELKRIEEAGGRVIYWDGARVLGVLAMSRAIGDNYLKPYVIPVPEVTVTKREVGDECLILASDGLWDVVPNETACQIVRMVLRGSGSPAASHKACKDAATLLTKLALARFSADNVTVMVVDLRR